MNHAIELRRIAKEADVVVFINRLYYPDGSTFEYTRLIDAEHMTEDMTDGMLKFYTDDLHYSMWQAIKEKRDE